MKLFKPAGLFLVTVLGASLPHAAMGQFIPGGTVNLDYQGYMAPAWTINFTLSGSPYNDISSGSPFQFDDLGVAGNNPFWTFCVEFNQSLPAPSGPNVTYQVKSLAAYSDFVGNAVKQARLERLYGHVFGGSFVGTMGAVTSYNPAALSAVERAAFQFAIWEIRYDTAYDLTAGSFYVNASQSPTYQANITSAKVQAATFLSAVWSGSGPTLQLLALESSTYQDQLYVIPEPGTWAAIFGAMALGCVMIVRTRRSRR